MKILAKTGNNNIATVYIAQTKEGKRLEFVESIQPPNLREDKWVLIISTLYGCPVSCSFCDAGGGYSGKISKEDLLNQINFLIDQYYPAKNIPVKKFKIQFARMGEPALNNNVLNVLDELPQLINAPGLMPSLSTVAPASCNNFFEQLLNIKDKHYSGKFQLQFSIHTTDVELRDKLIPIKKWGFEEIADYGKKFIKDGDKKITLNFALAENTPIEPEILQKYFPPDLFLIKITPINPTYKALKNNLNSYIKPSIKNYKIIDELKKYNYDVILSVGELEENNIGSNCGQYLTTFEKEQAKLKNSYTYKLEKV